MVGTRFWVVVKFRLFGSVPLDASVVVVALAVEVVPTVPSPLVYT